MGTPPTRPSLILEYERGSPEIKWPEERTSAAPRATDMAASVTMKGAIFEISNKEAVQGSYRQGTEEPDSDGERDADARVHQHRGDHTRQGEHGTDRQVDAPEDEDDRHSGRHEENRSTIPVVIPSKFLMEKKILALEENRERRHDDEEKAQLPSLECRALRRARPATLLPILFRSPMPSLP